MSTWQELKDHYSMQAHPEGGHFAETYRSSLVFQTKRGERNASTAIHFLLKKGEKSHLHRLTSDEGWHYHLGDPLRLIQITPSGKEKEIIIGPDFKAGQVMQYIVPAGHWFASESTGEFSFVGCTVSPGFDFDDFEMASVSQLKSLYPKISASTLKYALNKN